MIILSAYAAISILVAFFVGYTGIFDFGVPTDAEDVALISLVWPIILMVIIVVAFGMLGDWINPDKRHK